MRGLTAVTLALTLAFSAIPAVAQQKPATEGKPEADRSKLGARSVTGTVKKTTDNGFVVVGRESGQKDRSGRSSSTKALESTRTEKCGPQKSCGRAMPSR